MRPSLSCCEDEPESVEGISPCLPDPVTLPSQSHVPEDSVGNFKTNSVLVPREGEREKSTRYGSLWSQEAQGRGENIAISGLDGKMASCHHLKHEPVGPLRCT